jgi:hypothetical protein
MAFMQGLKPQIFGGSYRRPEGLLHPAPGCGAICDKGVR